jgi:formylglycine-generating enzyme required for sulfatase activity
MNILKTFGLVFLSVSFCVPGISQKKGRSDELSARTIEKNLAQVTDTLYAYRYETSNGEYNLFLQSLKANPSLYEKCLIDTTGWLSLPGYQEPMVNYYHKHPAFANHPVVNISYEAAIEYCRWITVLYNSDPKRKFNKVEFSLPTVGEWVKAAQGGRANAIFPWAGFYMRQKTGEYLCNFTHIAESLIISDKDGKPVVSESATEFAGSLSDNGFYTARVNSFHPNTFGIYNMSGNVAEMTTEKGMTKGGSWKSYGGEVTIQSSKVYDDPSPCVGFRVFMKVVEK